MLKALKCAHSLDPHNPQYHDDLIDFLLKCEPSPFLPLLLTLGACAMRVTVVNPQLDGYGSRLFIQALQRANVHFFAPIKV